MDELNQITTISTTVNKNPLEEMGVVITVNGTLQNEILGCNLKSNIMILIHFQGKSCNIMVIQVYAPTTVGKKLKLTSSVLTYKILQN